MMETVFFSLFAVGLAVLTLPELKDVWHMAACLVRKWCRGFRNEEEWLYGRWERFDERVFEHVRKLLQVTLSLGTRKSVKTFFLLSAGGGFGIFFLVKGRSDTGLALMAGVICMLLPYLLLQCMIQGKQVIASQEGEVLVTELLNNYKIHYCNMNRAIEVTAMTLEEAPHSQRLLLNLSRGLNKASTEAEMKALMEEFRFSIGTAWAGILSTNMLLACHSGLKVTESLSDLARSMSHARQLEEYSQRENNEARLILQYLVPAGCLLMIAGGIHFFGLTAGEWFHYQFQTGAGITWFVLWLLVYLATIGIHILFSRRKLDL